MLWTCAKREMLGLPGTGGRLKIELTGKREREKTKRRIIYVVWAGMHRSQNS